MHSLYFFNLENHDTSDLSLSDRNRRVQAAYKQLSTEEKGALDVQAKAIMDGRNALSLPQLENKQKNLIKDIKKRVR